MIPERAGTGRHLRGIEVLPSWLEVRDEAMVWWMWNRGGRGDKECRNCRESVYGRESGFFLHDYVAEYTRILRFILIISHVGSLNVTERIYFHR